MATTGETGANEAERRRWNDEYWTSVWPCREALTGAVTGDLLDHLQVGDGDRVLDVGSGAGATTIAVSRLVGATGSVVGVDISEALVAFARGRAAMEAASAVTFVCADAQVDAIEPPPFSVAMSQFGVMFFDEPQRAFANIRAHVEGGGRLAFACWQEMSRNPWFLGSAVGPLLPAPPVPAAGKSPTGPFALADPERTAGLLAAAGWVDVAHVPFERVVTVPRDAIVDDGQLRFVGVPVDRMADAVDAVETQLATFARPDGHFEVPLRYQIFTAMMPASG